MSCIRVRVRRIPLCINGGEGVPPVGVGWGVLYNSTHCLNRLLNHFRIVVAVVVAALIVVAVLIE